MIIKKTITPGKALDRLSALCARSEHCTREMEQKMARWGLAPADIQQVIETLKAEGFVDDKRYANAFAVEKLRFNQWGRRKIALGLSAKGIDETTADEAVNSLDGEEYQSILHQLLKSKYPSITAASDYERSMKLIKFAAGRGFTLDEIRQCIDSSTDLTDEQQD